MEITRSWTFDGDDKTVLNLKIDDFGENIGMRDRVNAYYRLLKDYMLRRGHDVVIHADHSYTGM